MTSAFSIARVSDIAPYAYPGLLFAIIFRFKLFYDSPDLITILGQLSL